MISIIIPVYNHTKKLDLCLQSIKAQSTANYEIIIVNDGSKEDLMPVFSKHKEFFGYKLEMIEQDNKGANVARNNGAKLAKGEFLIFCDADVIMKPDMLDKMSKTLKEHPEASYAYSSHKFGSKTFKCGPFDAEKMKEMPLIHTTSLIRKEHFPGFDPELKRLQDWDLWLTMLEQGHNGIWIDEVLFKVLPGGTMSNWLPSFAYKIFPFMPKVIKYKESVAIIKAKHNLS